VVSGEALASKEFWEAMDILQTVNMPRFSQELKDNLYLAAWLSALIKALWHGFLDLLPTFTERLLSHPKSTTFTNQVASVVKSTKFSKDMPLINAELVKKSFSALVSSLCDQMQDSSVFFNVPHLSGALRFSASGYNLTATSQRRSVFTQGLIRGQPLTLEDGKTACSQEEALAYAMCCRWSPLGNGLRFNPY
jgi:hypothetical protein